MAISYDEFLRQKMRHASTTGLTEVPPLNPMLFPFQRDVVTWALKKGRAAIFGDCGVGKTAIQIEYAKHVPGNVLIVAPLAVNQQTIKEGERFGIEIVNSRNGDRKGKITITNYEMLEKFKPQDYDGIVCDESGILKGFSGIYRQQLTQFASHMQWRLACTATPAPNDLIELTNHSEFLGMMSGKEIIALFFVQDGNTTHKWKLKGHARTDFWKFLASWSVAFRYPSDLGYNDNGFILPPLRFQEHTLRSTKPTPGMLFTLEAHTMDERRCARRDSIEERVAKVASIVNGTQGPWIVWCNLNDESTQATAAIDGAVQVTGSDDLDYKEQALLDFANGKIRCLVSKPRIAGHGLNFQNCADVVFLGLSDSFEELYQATRRCWRFGQKRPVTVHIVITEAEGAVRKNIARKEKQADEMMNNVIKHMKGLQLDMKKSEKPYAIDKASGNGWELLMGDSCELIKKVETETIGLSVYSPPFPGMYAYTDSERDVGNVRGIDELISHFEYMMDDLLRITMPGRSCCIHLTQEPIFKKDEGFTGLRDFRGRIIGAMQDHGWIYASERTLDKDPQLKAQRTKDYGLAMKTAAKDSSGLTGTMPDYLLQFRKPGENLVPIRALIDHPDAGKRNPDGWITREDWIQWASAVWYGRHRIGKGGIFETDVLSARPAKDADDEKHLAPLQLGVIERCIKLWSAPGDLVFDPFAGIGSTGHVAIIEGRRFLGIELKKSYWTVACDNLRMAEQESERRRNTLFSKVKKED